MCATPSRSVPERVAAMLVLLRRCDAGMRADADTDAQPPGQPVNSQHMPVSIASGWQLVKGWRSMVLITSMRLADEALESNWPGAS